jgi:hypothetical protein
MHSTPLRAVLTLFLSLQCVDAMAPLMCPGGAPLGRFVLEVAPRSSGAPLAIGTVNQLEAGETISYRPVDIMAAAKKKVRVALLLVPSDGSKILVFDPKPAAEPASWTVPFRTQLVSLVWGPEGLNKAKVASLVAKNNELIGQLADYATKTEETQALIQAITQQQTLDTGQNVDAAVAAFAQQYPSARIDPTQSTSAQLGTLLRGVNPSLSAYDPLAQNPQQQAAQTAGLAAAVAGLFFGNGVGLAATGGAVLVNLHSVLFPNRPLRQQNGYTAAHRACLPLGAAHTGRARAGNLTAYNRTSADWREVEHPARCERGREREWLETGGASAGLETGVLGQRGFRSRACEGEPDREDHRTRSDKQQTQTEPLEAGGELGLESCHDFGRSRVARIPQLQLGAPDAELAGQAFSRRGHGGSGAYRR